MKRKKRLMDVLGIKSFFMTISLMKLEILVITRIIKVEILQAYLEILSTKIMIKISSSMI